MAQGQLIKLGAGYDQALETFLREFDADPEELHGYFCARDAAYARVVDELDAWSRGEGLQEGWVPCTTWFWVDEGILQGVINLRHELTDALREVGGHVGYCVAPTHRGKGVATAMLDAVVSFCRQDGYERLLLTCDADNAASSRVIEANGGVLSREEWSATTQREQRWYSIELN